MKFTAPCPLTSKVSHASIHLHIQFFPELTMIISLVSCKIKGFNLSHPPPKLCWICKVRMLTCSWQKLHSQLLTWFVLNNSYYKRTCGLPQWSVWSGLSLTDMFQLCYSEGWDLWTPRSHRTPMIAEPLWVQTTFLAEKHWRKRTSGDQYTWW